MSLNEAMGQRCVSCGNDAGYNRAVVDVVSGGSVGAFCVNCERDEFGRSLERGHWGDVDGCAFCSRDGFYALPLWLPERVQRDGVVVSEVDYEVTDTTPTVCDEHFHALGDELDVPAANRTP